jgi:adenosine deaminase
MPKAELHVHLEGSIQPQTLLELARRRRIRLPADDPQGLRQWFRFRDFEHFVDIYLTCCRCLRDPEDFQLVTDQLLAEQQRQNVLYTEIHFTIGTHLQNGVNGDEVAAALHETLVRAEQRRGVIARLIPDIVRDVAVARADQTLGWALDGRRLGVVALGLSGIESTPSEPFREHFQVAAEEGLHRVAHAGEHQGPSSIRSVLDVCSAERIGHGIRAVDDAALVEELAATGIPLEVSPTSNVALKAVADLSQHPFRALEQAGVEVTVNSDDPALFGTTLEEEYLRLAEAFDYGPAELATFSWSALRHAFLEPAERELLEQRFSERFAELGASIEGPRVVVGE